MKTIFLVKNKVGNYILCENFNARDSQLLEQFHVDNKPKKWTDIYWLLEQFTRVLIQDGAFKSSVKETKQ